MKRVKSKKNNFINNFLSLWNNSFFENYIQAYHILLKYCECYLLSIISNRRKSLVTTKNMRNRNHDFQSYSLDAFIAHIHHTLQFINYNIIIKENLFKILDPRGIETFNN